jgi:NodT family efflux transporter outer membrane factor (OMF) lipoprotein
MHQLSVLAGQPPMALAALAAEESPIPAAPLEVPGGIPSDLLRQRPDIRRAERQLAAATAQIGVAVADLFPRFTLTGNVAMQSTKPRTLFNGGSLFFDVGPSMTWPVFDAGAIRANIRVKDAQQAQAAAVYEQTVLTALQEVEDALVAYMKEHAHRKALADAVDANRRALDLATKLFTHDRTDFLNVLDAQRALYASQNVLVQSDQAISADLVAIYKALGGGRDGHEQE